MMNFLGHPESNLTYAYDQKKNIQYEEKRI